MKVVPMSAPRMTPRDCAEGHEARRDEPDQHQRGGRRGLDERGDERARAHRGEAVPRHRGEEVPQVPARGALQALADELHPVEQEGQAAEAGRAASSTRRAVTGRARARRRRPRGRRDGSMSFTRQHARRATRARASSCRRSRARSTDSGRPRQWARYALITPPWQTTSTSSPSGCAAAIVVDGAHDPRLHVVERLAVRAGTPPTGSRTQQRVRIAGQRADLVHRAALPAARATARGGRPRRSRGAPCSAATISAVAPRALERARVDVRRRGRPRSAAPARRPGARRARTARCPAWPWKRRTALESDCPWRARRRRPHRAASSAASAAARSRASVSALAEDADDLEDRRARRAAR